MKKPRALVITVLSVAVAVMAIPVIAMAQSGPPPPPFATLWGQASGATNGQPVIAFVRSGGTLTYCGRDVVKNEPGQGTVYAVTVNGNSQTSGCGASGRQVQLYFAPHNGHPGAFASQTFSLTTSGAFQFNVTLGTQLSHKLKAPQLAAQVSH